MNLGPEEWVIIDVVANVLPMNDKIVVEDVKARVWGLVDDGYLPYTRAKLRIRVAGLDLGSDPSDGMPSVGDYLAKRSEAFKSKGTLERLFSEGMKASMGGYVAGTPAN